MNENNTNNTNNTNPTNLSEDDLELLRNTPLGEEDTLPKNIRDNIEVTTELEEQSGYKASTEVLHAAELKYNEFVNTMKFIEAESFQVKKEIIENFYDNLDDSAWNTLMKKYFKTNKEKSLFRHIGINQDLIDFEITKMINPNLHDLRYKTSLCERTKAWMISEDMSFAGNKPEILTFFNFSVFTIKAKINEDILIIPYQQIIDTIKQIENEYKYFLDYILIKQIPSYNFSKEFKQSKKLLNIFQENSEVLLNILRYRNDWNFQYSLVWNTIIKHKTVCKEIGYFTYGGDSRIIGNIWVDPAFRNRGLLGSIFKYIKSNILPKDKFVFITTKTDSVKGYLNEERFNELDHTNQSEIKYLYKATRIGNTLPYKPKLSKTNEKGLDQYIEELYVLTYKESENDSKFINWAINNINDQFLTQTLFKPGMYPILDIIYNTSNEEVSTGIKNLDYPTGGDLYYKIEHNLEPRENMKGIFQVIGFTNDKNICPKSYNYYLDEEVYNKHLIYRFKDEYYAYPCYNNELLYPLQFIDIRKYSIKLDLKNKVKVINEEYNYLAILKHLNGIKMITVPSYNIDKDQVAILFERLLLGAENLVLNKNNPSYPKNMKPVDFNYNTLELTLQDENEPTLITCIQLKQILELL